MAFGPSSSKYKNGQQHLKLTIECCSCCNVNVKMLRVMETNLTWLQRATPIVICSSISRVPYTKVASILGQNTSVSFIPSPPRPGLKDLPEVFENNMAQWMEGFHMYLTSYSNPLLDQPEGSEAPGPVERVQVMFLLLRLPPAYIHSRLHASIPFFLWQVLLIQMILQEPLEDIIIWSVARQGGKHEETQVPC